MNDTQTKGDTNMIDMTANEIITEQLADANAVAAIKPDGWKLSGCITGRVDWTDQWENAWVIKGYNMSYPIRVEISGRDYRYSTPLGSAVRVKITWLHDGEPNTESRGWLKVGRY
jgi:hypothetical protein